MTTTKIKKCVRTSGASDVAHVCAARRHQTQGLRFKFCPASSTLSSEFVKASVTPVRGASPQSSSADELRAAKNLAAPSKLQQPTKDFMTFLQPLR
jgi:hypothetical protein